MDLKQTKLTKTEWNNTEIPISDNEKFILNVIKQGYSDVNIKKNMNKSLFDFVKIEYNAENEILLYEKYFEKELTAIIKKYGHQIKLDNVKSQKKSKKIDVMRVQNMDNQIKLLREKIFEFDIIAIAKNILKSLMNSSNDIGFYIYTLIQLKKSTILNVNKYVMNFVNQVLDISSKRINIEKIIISAYQFIEKNPNILKYEDVTLFSHQKELFTIFQESSPKLVLYIAPTGTGKTLSPIGLSQNYKIIFICVSRHVGLALAKSAISMDKKIGFAFGCTTASDIRLHNSAASEYTLNKKTGGIGKIDNSVGDKVEIMISDVQSYLVAMNYMLAFNNEDKLVTYWDEPTITMDYETHELHEQIKKNWKENLISKMVLSCATLPKEEEIYDTISDFKCKFENSTVHTINSFDFKKSISLLNKDCFCVLPHYMYDKYSDLLSCVQYCENNKTLLRYFDLSEIIKFIIYVNQYKLIHERYELNNYFKEISDITMYSLKQYYLLCLRNIQEANWEKTFNHFKQQRNYKFDTSTKLRRVQSMDIAKPSTQILSKSKSMDSNLQDIQNPGIFLTTRDANTLTDGPTIYMVNDIKQISNFYIKMTNIPVTVFRNIMNKINTNNVIQEKIDKLQMTLDDKLGGCDSEEFDSRKNDRKEENSPELKKIVQEIDNLRMQIQYVNLENIYVPNKQEHQIKWNGDIKDNAFSPDIDESVVRQIMELDVDDSMKILLLLGIGTFDNNVHPKYLEIMKDLAYNQKLYLIIASTDYIYGTNYSFCHGYIGKDLTNMTQQKIIQAMGRIGRNKIQQDYTIRFRDDSMITKLFSPIEHNMEAINMCKLFNSD